MPPRIARDRNDGIGASAAFPPFAHLLHKPHLNYVGAVYDVYDRAVLFEIDELRAVIDRAYSAQEGSVGFTAWCRGAVGLWS